MRIACALRDTGLLMISVAMSRGVTKGCLGLGEERGGKIGHEGCEFGTDYGPIEVSGEISSLIATGS